MATASMRSITFTLQEKPYRRLKRPNSNQTGIRTLLLDSIDLWSSFRGINWEWSDGLHVPSPSSPSSRLRFLLHQLQTLSIQVVIFDFLHYYAQGFDPQGFGSPKGGTIFNMDYAPFRRYTDPRTLYLTLLAGIVVYLAIEIAGSLPPILAISIFNCPEEDWPLVSDKPWNATSLNEFWGKRWHQLFRFSFIEIGYKPFAWISGGNRVVGVMGAFFLSGVMHYLGTWGQYPNTSFVDMVGFFMMMGVGVVLERVWGKMTGKKVGGPIGWIWTFAWLLFWGQLAVDAWGQAGMISSEFFGKSWRPSYKVFGPLSA